MEGAERAFNGAEGNDQATWRQWQASLKLLELMRSDYQRARRHLEDMCTAFGEREHATGQYLRTALELAAPPGPPSIGRTTRLPFLLGVVSAPVLDAPRQRHAGGLPAATLQVRCLGSFEVRVGWQRVESWRSNKAKSLLKYLISQQGRPVPKDVLMETLWPEGDPQASNNNLKAAVHALRQTLNPGGRDGNARESGSYVLFLDGNYVVNAQADVWVDVDEFESQWARGRRLDKEGRPDEASVAYASAERLYRGDFLEEDPYEDWMLLRREALKDTYLAILGKLGERSMVSGDCESCIVYSQRILAKDACREDAYRNLMRCHSRLGHRSRALDWYRICERTLRAELDADPDRETAALHRRLLDGEDI